MLEPMEHERLHLDVGSFHLNADLWHGGEAAHVLLLHGLGGNSITWHGVGALIAQKLQASVLAVDLPGFGGSRPKGASVDISVLTRVVEAILHKQAPAGARWRIAGNSLGGVLALAVACRVPERVEHVTLASLALPLTWGRTPREFAALRDYVPAAVPFVGRRLVERYVRATGVPGVVDDPVRMLFRDPTRLDETVRERLIAISEYRLTWAGEAARALEQTTRSLGIALLRPSGSAGWIRRTPCPVRAIFGTHDPLYPSAAWERLKKTRPDWEYLAMAGVGHVPQLEAPDEFAALMLSR
jgi:pimeloyl-ACP methyl ester carboxylesterase